MASRGGDGTLKLWDLRAFKKPLAAWDGLDTNYANTSCCFSPDERLLLTGKHMLTGYSCARLDAHKLYAIAPAKNRLPLRGWR
jgi:WD40 repeat protein